MRTYYVSSGQISTGIILISADYMYVYDGGTASRTWVKSSGFLCISSGGTADSTTVNSGGSVFVSSGGTATNIKADGGTVLGIAVASDTYIQGTSFGSAFEMKNACLSGYTVNSGVHLDVSSGGLANSTSVKSRGSVFVSSGGTANSTTVYYNGDLYVFAGGTANSTTVNSGGYLYVSSGGTALNVHWVPTFNSVYSYNAGGVDMGHGTVVTFSGVSGCYWGIGGVYSSSAMNMESLILTGRSNDYNRSLSAYIMSGGTANAIIFDADYAGELYVLNGGKASETSLVNGHMDVYCSGIAERTIVYQGGYLEVNPGGQVSDSLITGDGATLHVYSGGTADKTVVKNIGLFYLSGGTADSTTVKNMGQFWISSGGTASRTDVSDWGAVYLLYGGSADEISVDSCGELHIGRGGIATSIRENGGHIEVAEGAQVTFAPNIFSGLKLHDTATVHEQTLALDTTVLNGELHVFKDGIASTTTVTSDGAMMISSGGAARNVTVSSGGLIAISDGGRMTGSIELTSGAKIRAESGSIIEFDLCEARTEATARVNDLSLIQGAPDYTVTISADQAEGVYKLAEGSGGFDKSVTVYCDNTALGSLSVGQTVTLGGQDYTLNLNDSLLSFTVGAVVPVVPGVSDDLNGDGRADIVMTITQSGHGAEGATGAWMIQQDQTAAWGDLSQRNPGWEIFGMGRTAAGKQTADVYVRSTGNVIGAWTTDESGHVAGWETVGEFSADTQVLGLGDFNGNGQTDLLLRNTNGAVGCYFTGGDVTGWNYFQSLGDEWKISAVGDLNGDGRADVVLKHDAGFAGSWLTQSDYTMAWADLDTLQEGFAIVGAGDFNGDGTDDVLLKNGNYYGAWIVQNGNAAGWMGLGDLGDVTVEQIADFDGDGKDDLRIRTAAGDLGAQLVRGADNLEWHYYGSVGSEWSTGLATAM